MRFYMGMESEIRSGLKVLEASVSSRRRWRPSREREACVRVVSKG